MTTVRQIEEETPARVVTQIAAEAKQWVRTHP
jgi:hypothetical protein